MKNMVRTFLSAPRLILFGFTFAVISGFGQTFLLSFFAPFWMELLDINKGQFGNYYSIATLTSAAMLPYIGKMIDHVSLKTYATYVGILLVIAMFLTSRINSLSMMLIALFLLRLTAQGLSTHITATSVARYFTVFRGRALSLAFLGTPIPESILPWLVSVLVVSFSWQTTWLILTGAAAVLVVFAILILDSSAAEPKIDTNIETNGGKSWTRSEVLSDPRFFLILPSAFLPAFSITGLLLFQVDLAEYKGWDVKWLAVCFLSYSVTRAFFSFFSGYLIDRFGAVRLYPLHLLPLFLGFLLLSVWDHHYVVPFYFACFGCCVGLAGGIKTAFWVETYGTKSLGAIRSMVVTVALFSSASSPAIVGNLLEVGVSYQHLFVSCLIMIGVFSVMAGFACHAYATPGKKD